MRGGGRRSWAAGRGGATDNAHQAREIRQVQGRPGQAWDQHLHTFGENNGQPERHQVSSMELDQAGSGLTGGSNTEPKIMSAIIIWSEIFKTPCSADNHQIHESNIHYMKWWWWWFLH